MVSLFSVPRAWAWTHEINNYDNNHNDYLCGGSSSRPCLYWAQGYHQSISIYAYIDSTLYTQGYDFRPSLKGAFSSYNSVNAWNPYFYDCYSYGSGGCGTAYYQGFTLPACVLGETYIGDYGTVKYSQSLNQYYATWNSVTVSIQEGIDQNGHPLITWNTNLTFNCDPKTGKGTADSRTAVAHETGHAQALGHTGYTNALMHGTPTCSCYTPQSNDISGLQAIYPGYYPA